MAVCMIKGDEKRWYLHNKLHREDGPAVDSKDKKIWYRNGKLHRETAEGPALLFEGGTEAWCIDGKLHREDGPAVTYVPYGQASYFHEVLPQCNCIYWHKFSQEWWARGKRHRRGGPAIIYEREIKRKEHSILQGEWWIHGKLHRLDGPSVVREDEIKFYYINGKICGTDEFREISEEMAARIIQKACWNWLTKPVTGDGKLGIDLRISLRKIYGHTDLYPSESVKNLIYQN